MNRSTTALAEKISSLTLDQIREVEDFVDFVRLRGEERAMTAALAAASNTAFEAVWSNPEDDAYDAI